MTIAPPRLGVPRTAGVSSLTRSAVVPSGVYAVDNAGNVYAWKLPYQMGIQSRVRQTDRRHQTRFDLIRETHYTRRHP